MYRRILVPLENSATDAAILEHVRKLARHCGASLLLIHVADGWAARNIRQLDLRESEEMRTDREGCDLIAMSTHGHRFVKDVLFGSVANEVRHRTTVPVLLVRAPVARRSGEVRAVPAEGGPAGLVR